MRTKIGVEPDKHQMRKDIEAVWIIYQSKTVQDYPSHLKYTFPCHVIFISLSQRSLSSGDLSHLVSHANVYYFGELCTDPEEDGRCKLRIDFPEPVTTVSAL